MNRALINGAIKSLINKNIKLFDHQIRVTATAQFHRRANNQSNDRKRFFEKNSADDHENSVKFGPKSGFYGVGIVLSTILAIYLYENKRDNDEMKPRSISTTLCKSIPNMDDNDEKLNDENERKNGGLSSMNVIADIAEDVSPSVAYVEALQKCPNPFAPMSMMTVSSGSGFLVDDDGHNSGIIITNAHVIANCQKVIVRFNDDRRIEGEVEFIDERLDLATVRVPLSQVRHLKPIKLIDSSKKIRPGEWVIAVGAPFTLSNTVTVGVVSSISRAARDLGIGDSIEYIQTDASINIGNSGGPLLNLDGKAIGITTLKVGEGVSFAIPASYARNFLNRCSAIRNKHNNNSIYPNDSTNNGKLNANTSNKPKLYIGFTIVTLTEPLMESYRRHGHSHPSDLDFGSGVLVYRVVEGSPAHLGGLKNGDIIVTINGHKVQTAEEVYKILQQDNHKSLEFVIKRDHEKEMKLQIHPKLILDY